MSGEGRRAQFQVAVENLWGWGQVQEGRLLLASAAELQTGGRWRWDGGARQRPWPGESGLQVVSRKTPLPA